MKKTLIVLGIILALILVIVTTVVVTLMIADSQNKSTLVDSNSSQDDAETEEDDKDLIVYDELVTCDIDSGNQQADEELYDYDFTYPVFSCSNEAAEAELNTYVEDAIAEYVDPIISESTDMNFRSFGSSSYDVYMNRNRFLSVRINYSVNLLGGTGNSGIIPVNYDLLSQEFMDMEDLFPDTEDYLEIVSDRAIEILKDNLSDPSLHDQIESGASADEENYRTFVFDESTLIIVFDKYQVAAGALGNPEVTIPFAEIE